MRIIFCILLILHGLIHLLGFVKGYALSEVRQLTLPISKQAGMVWLLTFVLFVATALLFVLRNNYWWAIGLVAVVLSQLLVISCWPDAKAGTWVNLLLLIVVVIGYATHAYHRRYEKDVQMALHQKTYFGNDILLESDMIHLPESVKKYLRFSGAVGKPKVNNFKIEFKGRIRKDEQSAWMSFTSEQYNFMETPTRLFFMKAVMKGLPVAGYHCFNNGDAFMDIRLLSLFKVQYMEGEEMDMAETVTFFNDMCCMAPSTLIDKRITWKEEEAGKVKAVFTNKGISISADLYFNEQGELINFVSNDRYAADAGRKLPWSTPLKQYKEINGYRLAGEAETIYAYPEKDLCYGQFELVSIRYNCPNTN